MERPRQRLADRAREPLRDPLAQLGGGAAAERQDQDLLGVDAVALDPVDHRLDQRRGLARAGTRQDQQRPAAVLDHSALGGVEHRRGHRRPRCAHQPD